MPSYVSYAKHDLPPIKPVYPAPKPVDFSLIEMRLAGHVDQLNKIFYDLVERGRVIDETYGGGGSRYVGLALLTHRHCRNTYQILAELAAARSGAESPATPALTAEAPRGVD